MKLSSLQYTLLCLFFFSINFEVWDPLNTDGNFSISKLTGFLYVFSLIPQFKNYFRIKEFKRYLVPLWIFFFLLTTINIININSRGLDFLNFPLIQNIILLIFLINHSKRVPGILERALMYFALGSVTLAFLFYLGIGITHDADRIRLFGDNENEIGIRMCISVIYLFYLVIQNPLRLGSKRFLLFLPIPVMLVLLVATASRVAFISFSVCFMVSLLLIKTRRAYSKAIILVIGIIIGAYISNYVLSSGILYQRLVSSAEEYDLSNRNVLWKSLFPLIKNNPVFGVGNTGYAQYCYQVFGRIISPHNVIIEVLCYCGIVGLLIYLWFLFRILKIGVIKYRSNGSFIQLVLLIPLLGLILSGQLLTSKIGWVLFAFAIGQMASSKIFTSRQVNENSLRHR